jgi:hypothetical protein
MSEPTAGLCSVCAAAQHRARHLNDELRSEATRHYRPWTAEEFDLATRDDLTAVEVAEKIGRSMFAIYAARKRARRKTAQTGRQEA